ncbi:MAG: hypothetical protein AAF125_24240, partial [Chloroflexota bacterium]
MALEYPFELPATLFHSIGMPIDTKIERETLEAFAKTLMVVSGADDRLSVWERGWLTAYLSAYGADDALLRQLDDFDYKAHTVDEYLTGLLEGPYSKWVKRSLLQGSIRMARADSVSVEEAASIQRLGAMLGMSEDAVNEVISLVEMFDSVTGTNAVLLSIAKKEDADEILQTRQMELVLDNWDADDESTVDNQEITPAQDQLMAQSMITFAKALLYVAAADGVVSEEEIAF